MTIPDIFVGQIWVVVSLFLILIYTLMNRSANSADRLRASGIRAAKQPSCR